MLHAMAKMFLFFWVGKYLYLSVFYLEVLCSSLFHLKVGSIINVFVLYSIMTYFQGSTHRVNSLQVEVIVSDAIFSRSMPVA